MGVSLRHGWLRMAADGRGSYTDKTLRNQLEYERCFEERKGGIQRKKTLDRAQPYGSYYCKLRACQCPENQSARFVLRTGVLSLSRTRIPWDPPATNDTGGQRKRLKTHAKTGTEEILGYVEPYTSFKV